MKISNVVLRTGTSKFFNLHKNSPGLICFFDSSFSSLNVGDQIINESGIEQLNTVFYNKQYFKASTHNGVSSIGIHNVNLCEERIVCGSNLLCDTMFRSANWNLGPIDILRLKKCVLMGVGWNKYGEKTSYTTKFFYNLLLDKGNRIHSVRDEYTKKKLEQLGIKNVLNTGCPTMWKLTQEHCKKVRVKKSSRVVFTITDYDKDFDNDKYLINALKNHYEEVYFWPQGSGDNQYFDELNEDGVYRLAPQLESYDALLDKFEDIDFVGTRLHGGIRALQKFKRTLIIGIDNRAIEKAKDFNLPVILRSSLKKDFVKVINDDIECKIKINEKEIKEWLGQFDN